MKVKIYRCSTENSWYKDRIGEEFEVETHASEIRYKVKGQNRLIELSDTKPAGGFKIKTLKKTYKSKEIYEELRAFLQIHNAHEGLKQGLYKIYKLAEEQEWWNN